MADPSDESQKAGCTPLLLPQSPSQCNIIDRAIVVYTASTKETHGLKNITTNPSTPQPKAVDQADLDQQPLLTLGTMLVTYMESLIVDTEPVSLGNQGPPNSSSTLTSPFKIDRGNVRTLAREALPTPPPILNSPATFPDEKDLEMEQEKTVTFQDSPGYSATSWTPPET